MGILDTKVMGKIIEIQARRAFKTIVLEISKSVTPSHLEYLAINEIPFSDIMTKVGKNIQIKPTPLENLNPGIKYILTLTDQEVINLLLEVIPEHVVVLRKYPIFTQSVIKELRGLVRRS